MLERSLIPTANRPDNDGVREAGDLYLVIAMLMLF